MDIEFKKLTPERMDDFFYYFDHDAFSDHEEWMTCYCLESHLSERENKEYVQKEKRQSIARHYIQNGVLTGYLLYDDGKVMGWCNTGDKSGYAPICDNQTFFTEDPQKQKIKIIYCIDVAPAYRGKGIADLIVDKVLTDAKEEGYAYVEGYPFTDADFAYQYRGPLHLYEKHGFQMYRHAGWVYIMRKAL